MPVRIYSHDHHVLKLLSAVESKSLTAMLNSIGLPSILFPGVLFKTPAYSEISDLSSSKIA